MIPVSQPDITELEREYVADAVASGWVAQGPYIERFEAAFAAWQGYRHCVATCNGSVALHLAMVSMGIGCDDEVILPTLTYAATAAAVAHAGATPVFVDSCADGTLDTALVAEATTERTALVLPVHLYGVRAKLEALAGYRVLVDAAEGHGIDNAGAPACYSFYGNKILTTGEGGAVCTDDAELAAKLRHLRGQAQTEHRFWHDAAGYNYRMSNINAALGLAQVERADEMVAKRRELMARYGVQRLRLDRADVPWLASWRCHPRDDYASYLASVGVETRPCFPQVHTMPVYHYRYVGRDVAARISNCLLSLPLSSAMSTDDVDYICNKIKEHTKNGKPENGDY